MDVDPAPTSTLDLPAAVRSAREELAAVIASLTQVLHAVAVRSPHHPPRTRWYFSFLISNRVFSLSMLCIASLGV